MYERGGEGRREMREQRGRVGKRGGHEKEKEREREREREYSVPIVDTCAASHFTFHTQPSIYTCTHMVFSTYIHTVGIILESLKAGNVSHSGSLSGVQHIVWRCVLLYRYFFDDCARGFPRGIYST